MDISSEFYSSTPMGEAVRSNSRTSREMESLSLEITKYPRDLLQLATNQSSLPTPGRELGKDEEDDDDGDGEDDDGGLNLGLGLSLGGKFGVDKSHKGLKRSSSMIGTMPLAMEDEMMPSMHTLARTASLPLETEDEWRKRKEMQTFRRMEAKRRRSEKQRSLKGGGGGEEEKGFESSISFCRGINSKFGGSSMVGNPFEMKGRRTTFGSLQGFLTNQAQQGCPNESQGAGSSSASDIDSRSHQGSGNWGESINSASIQSSLRRCSNRAKSPFPCKVETPEICFGPQVEGSVKQTEKVKSGVEDMPSVFTIGDGKKVEGILYKYGKGEEARIMCVCHGSFFSPAEFVRHAGVTNVEHPLRHIVVSPSPSALR